MIHRVDRSLNVEEPPVSDTFTGPDSAVAVGLPPSTLIGPVSATAPLCDPTSPTAKRALDADSAPAPATPTPTPTPTAAEFDSELASDRAPSSREDPPPTATAGTRSRRRRALFMSRIIGRFVAGVPCLCADPDESRASSPSMPMGVGGGGIGLGQSGIGQELLDLGPRDYVDAWSDRIGDAPSVDVDRYTRHFERFQCVVAAWVAADLTDAGPCVVVSGGLHKREFAMAYCDQIHEAPQIPTPAGLPWRLEPVFGDARSIAGLAQVAKGELGRTQRHKPRPVGPAGLWPRFEAIRAAGDLEM